MALNIKITSPTEPGTANVNGGTITITDNGDGTWQLTSNDVINFFRLDANKADITEIKIIAEELTQLNTDSVNWHQPLGTFYGCTNLVNFIAGPETFKNATWCYAAWMNCSGLKEFPEVNLENATNLCQAWQGCATLEFFPELKFLSVTDLGLAWRNCTSLKTMQKIIAPNATNYKMLFYNCTELRMVKGVDTSNSNDSSHIFGYCDKLIHPNATERTYIENGFNWKTEQFVPEVWRATNPVMAQITP